MVYFILGIVCLAAIGALVGAFRRFTNTSKWGLTVLVSFLVLLIVGAAVQKTDANYAYIASGVAIGTFIVMMIVLGIVSKVISSAKKAKLEYNSAKAADDLKEVEELIQNAIDKKDDKEYKKLLKRQKKLNRVTAGAAGVSDVVLGCISGGVNVGIAVTAVVFTLLMIAEFSLGVLPPFGAEEFFANLFAEPLWTDVCAVHVLDILLLCILGGCLFVGFRSGIFSFISVLFLIGLIVLAGYGSYAVASGELCAGLVTSISDGLLSVLPEAVASFKPMIATIIITVLIFAVLLVLIIIAAIFIPKLVEKLRDNSVFLWVDGILGAVILLAIVFALLLFAGGLAYNLLESAGLAKYFGNSAFADCFYTANPLNGYIANLVTALRDGTLFGVTKS